MDRVDELLEARSLVVAEGSRLLVAPAHVNIHRHGDGLDGRVGRVVAGRGVEGRGRNAAQEWRA